MLISLIISTYNRPAALSLVLQALNYQTDKNFEVIIADDGSSDETRKLIQELQANLTKSTLDLTVKTDMDC